MRYRSTIASFAVAVLAAMSSFCSHAGLTSTWHLPANGLDPSALVYASAPVGAPQIPYINLAVRIPDGASLAGVEVVTSAYEVVSTGVAPEPIAKPHLPGTQPELTEPDESLYVDKTSIYEIAGEETASGIRFLAVKVYPRHYLKEGDIVKEAKALTLRFNWNVTAAVSQPSPGVSPALQSLALAGDNVVRPDAATGAADAVRLFVNVPSVEGLDRYTYAGYFKKTAVANGDGTFDVAAVLDADKVKPLIGESVAGAEDAFVIDEDGSVSITVANPKLGLYYGIKVMDAPSAEGEIVWLTDMSGATAPKSLRVSKETLDALVTSSPSAFFRIVVGFAIPEE